MTASNPRSYTWDMQIHQLSPQVVDQIAAGEVIERPAQMLKELLENSIDAGADQIDIEVDQGGRKLSILDNGSGMGPEDLPLSVARHATSKISKSEDLYNLHSFGFRGEALASISSVSRLQMISKLKDADKAYSLKVNFGEKAQLIETGAKPGTQIHISELFENLPARKKFLKSDSAEITAIKNCLKAFALSHPNVGFKFKSKSQLVFNYQKVESLLERAKQVLEMDELFYTEFEFEDFKSRIIFSAPNKTMRVRKGMWFFVQDRWVQDRSLQAAVMEAYRSLLMHGEYPHCVCFVDCPPDEVDVNIHPTKSQVKFASQDKAFRVINRGLRMALEKTPWIQIRADRERELSEFKKKEVQVSNVEAANLIFNTDDLNRTQFAKKEFSQNVLESQTTGKTTSSQVGGGNSYSVNQARAEYKNQTGAPQKNVSGQELSKLQESEDQGFWSQLEVIGQSHTTYILCQSNESIMIVDQHAAHERVLYERLMKNYREGGLSSQKFLIPLTLEFSTEMIEALVAHQQVLTDMGIELEQAGPQSVSIESLPEGISESGAAKSIELFANEVLEQGGSFAVERYLSHVFATMACHSAIRAGKILSKEEMVSLLRQMDDFPLSSFCPHGRPVYVEYPITKLEKDFGRVL